MMLEEEEKEKEKEREREREKKERERQRKYSNEVIHATYVYNALLLLL